MVVSDDKKTAIVAWFRTLYTPNKCFTRMKLHGLDPDALYSCNVLGGQALTVSKTPDGKRIYETGTKEMMILHRQMSLLDRIATAMS